MHAQEVAMADAPDDRQPPEIRCQHHSTKTLELRTLPNVQTLVNYRMTSKDRTYNAYLRTVTMVEAHVPLRPLRLYILLLLPLSRVNKLVAH